MTTDIRHAEVEILPDNDAVAEKMAEILIEAIRRKLASGAPVARIALSGGSTPKRLFEILARPDMAGRIDWKRVELFYGDERHVPAGHADSNHTMALQTLLSHVPIPPGQVHPVPTAGTPAQDAALYQQALQKAYGSDVLQKGRPLFDVVMLGLGPDGHTASLFPDQPVLGEKNLWVSTAAPTHVPHERVTLTYPALASSDLVVFLITGKGKVPMLKRLREGDPSIPAAHVTSDGRILILADRAAAGETP
ncbi:6-phosphogluconolactonase [Oecophyllibacter saccharovorans]|uniref:6-phosphogluconolactonase n=1 Tax=Oecophyllibacter saccharovorans TaxID=2558360 RepID=UPI00114417D3|nr:6-phosphogluconolactonase [Oecophyllibacter saccharovorans]QDH15545.1 6-phosphogluconolactonase [Oecophyllibacter saccharovorans]